MAQKFGEYEILVRLAAGGMAEIFLARKEEPDGPGRFVVVKKILPHLAEQKRFRLMFFDEAHIAARLDHPNIVQVYELGSEGDEPFLAMEYLEGQSLATVLRKAFQARQPLPPGVAISIGTQVCEGLHHAHEMTDAEGKPSNLVHRDLSPQNIFVNYSGVVKVLDFGVAYVEEKLVRTRTGTVKGKYAYMSPEQVASKRLDRRSDIFGLGVVMWEALVCERLFRYANDLATAEAIAYARVQPPSRARPGIPPELDEVVLKALHKDPDQRFRTAAEFMLALRAAGALCGLQTGAGLVADHMRASFAENIARHKELLQAAEEGTLDILTPGALKPETDESLDFSHGESDHETASLEANKHTRLERPAPVGQQDPPTPAEPVAIEAEPERSIWIPLALLIFVVALAFLLLSGVFDAGETGSERFPGESLLTKWPGEAALTGSTPDSSPGQRPDVTLETIRPGSEQKARHAETRHKAHVRDVAAREVVSNLERCFKGVVDYHDKPRGLPDGTTAVGILPPDMLAPICPGDKTVETLDSKNGYFKEELFLRGGAGEILARIHLVMMGASYACYQYTSEAAGRRPGDGQTFTCHAWTDVDDDDKPAHWILRGWYVEKLRAFRNMQVKQARPSDDW